MRNYIFLLALLISSTAFATLSTPGGGGASTFSGIAGDPYDNSALATALDAKLDINSNPEVHPDGNAGGFNYANTNVQVKPLQDSPSESWNFFNRQVNIDPDSTGFEIGTGGTFGAIFNLGYNHQGTSDLGNTQYITTYSSFGNGTDPFSLKGFQFWLGFGNVNSGVTITDSIQGFGMQWNIDAGATLGSSSYFNGFYDNMNVNTTVQSYNSFSSNPHIANIATNHNGVAFNSAATVDSLTGNATYFGFVMNGDFGATSMGANAGVQGININPTVHNFGTTNYFNGVYSSTLNITGPGTNKWAGFFEGDVHIGGDLEFTGGLGIGKLNAFHQQDVIDGGGNPQSVHSMISSMVVPNGTTVNNADTIGTNTAMLIDMQDNSTFNSGPFGIGLVGLALPAVVQTGTGSNGDYVGGAAFVITFAGSSTGGHIGQGYGGAFFGTPPSATTLDRFYGMWSKKPFGNIATDDWAAYLEDAPSYMEDGLKIGGSDGLTGGDKFQVSGNSTHFGDVVVKDGDFKITQTTAPTTTVQSSAGTGASCSVDATASDAVGQVTINTGTVGISTGSYCKINFNTSKSSAPICIFTPASSTISPDVYVTSTTSDFDVNFNLVAGVSSSYVLNYHCISNQ